MRTAIRPDPEQIQFRRLDDMDHGHYSDHMGTTLTATEAKGRFLSLLDRVASGEEIEITRHGRSVARLVPAVGPHALGGSLAGIAMTADPDDDLLTTGDEWNAA